MWGGDEDWGRGFFPERGSGDGDGEKLIPIPIGDGDFSPMRGGAPPGTGIPRPIAISNAHIG